MRRFILPSILLCLSISTYAQSNNQATPEQLVQAVVETLLADKNRAAVLLTDLTDLSGYVTRVEQTWFTLSDDKQNKARTGMKVRFSEVLAISSKTSAISFIPDPRTAPYG